MAEPGSASSHTHSDISPWAYQDPVGSALSNPVTLDSVFGYLDLDSLKWCRKVCTIWSNSARPFMYSKSTICIRGPPPKISLQDRLNELEAAKIPCRVNYKVENRKSKLVPILYKIQGNVETLTLDMNPNDDGWKDSFEDEPFENVRFMHLKSITLESTCSLVEIYDEDKVKECVQLFLEIINRSPNLQELHFSKDKDEMGRIFFETLLCREGLPLSERFKANLKSLSLFMNKSGSLNNEDIEAFHQMKLKLKTLSVPIIYGEDAVLQVPALSKWLADLSSTLEDLSITRLKYRIPQVDRIPKLEFPLEMKKLKTLHLADPARYGVDEIIALLKKMTNLKTLTLTYPSCLGVKRKEFLDETFNELSFPNLEELTIWKNEFKKSDCQPGKYVPKLFPSLKILVMTVYSKNSLLACMYDLKDMMIEELGLELKSRDSSNEEFEPDIKACVPSGWSFTSWKKLRQFSLNYPTCSKCKNKVGRCSLTHESSLTKVYNMPMELILPGSLTSLTLQDLGQIDGCLLVKLLCGMPLLMHLDLEGGFIVKKEGKRMKRSVFMDWIRKEPCINPHLYIPNWEGLFSS